MVKKKYSANDLAKFYHRCPLFKNYVGNKFWGSQFNYSNDLNLRYCKKYIYKRIRVLILRYLLEYCSSSFVLVLYKSYRFVKFLKSGFVRYLNFQFLLAFYNNVLASSLQTKVFIEKYFKRCLNKKIKKDLSSCINKCLIEQVLNSLGGGSFTRLKYLYNQGRKSLLWEKGLLLKKKIYTEVEPCLFIFLVRPLNIYKSESSYQGVVDIKPSFLFYSNNASVVLSFFLFGPVLKAPLCENNQINFARVKNISEVFFKVVDFSDDFNLKVGLHKNIDIVFKVN